MIGLLLSMYPARWRRRYGEEFRAVLESRPLGPFDVADVFLGALDARLTPLGLPGTAPSGGGHLMLLRIGGFGAVIGGVAWFIGIIGASAGGGSGSPAWLAVMLAGTLGLLVALVGLSAFQAHRDPKLAWVAFVVPAAGAVVSAVGAAGMLVLPENASLLGLWSPWAVWLLGLLAIVLGSILFAVATYQARVLSSRAARALGWSSGVVAMIMALSLGGTETGAPAQVVLVASLAAFAASWAWLGISALRRGPIREVAPA